MRRDHFIRTSSRCGRKDFLESTCGLWLVACGLRLVANSWQRFRVLTVGTPPAQTPCWADRAPSDATLRAKLRWSGCTCWGGPDVVRRYRLAVPYAERSLYDIIRSVMIHDWIDRAADDVDHQRSRYWYVAGMIDEKWNWHKLVTGSGRFASSIGNSLRIGELQGRKHHILSCYSRMPLLMIHLYS